MARIPKVILLVEASGAYGRGLLRGIARYAQLHGPWTFYSEPEYFRISGFGMYHYGKNSDLMSCLKNWHADGVIVRVLNPKKLIKILPKKIAIIVLPTKNKIAGLHHIMADHIKIGKMGAEYLLECGYVNFGFCGIDEGYWSRLRRQGFCATIAQAGHRAYLFKSGGKDNKPVWYEELHAIASWLRSVPMPIAVMACNDIRARHLAEASKIAHLKVPEEVAILGVNNDEIICELSDPPLSSITLNTEKAGFEAAKLLDRLMAGEKIKEQEIVVEPTHVIPRRSTDLVAVRDNEVAKAIRFIRQNINKPIQVADVVAATLLSRRVLEKRFHSKLRRSILEHIRRMRTQAIIRLLMETDMPVSEIAKELRFPSCTHLSRFFHRTMGISPNRYRKKYRKK